MFERFTAGARAVVVVAQEQAHELGSSFIGTEHLMLAMLDDRGGTVARLLGAHHLDVTTVRADVQRLLGDHEPDLSFTEADAEDAAALKSIGIDLDQVRAAIEENFGGGSLLLPPPAPRKRGLFGRQRFVSSGRIPFSPRAKKVLELSLREAIRLHHNFIAPEHLMLGVLREGEGLACQILAEHGVAFDALRDDLTASLREAAA
jgi:ATP-dependent Clp protease ATP-binding subunit ClpA